jgi:restriction system protein
MPDNVVKLNGLIPYIKSKTKRILSERHIELFVDKLRNPPDLGDSYAHIQNVRKNQLEPICPRCGSNMILRTAKKGRNAGSQFWGRTNYPK